MISFSKSKFAVLGFVMVAVLLIPANDAIADHSNDSTNYEYDHGLQMLTWSVNVVPPNIYQPAESIVLEMEGTLNLINTDRNHFIKFHIKNPDGVEVKTLPTYFRDGEFNTGNILIFNDFGIHSVEWSYTGTSETISIPKGFLGTFEVVEYSADTTPPVITVPSDQTFTTTDPAGYVYDFSVSATDNVAIDIYGPSNAGPGIFCVDLITNSTSPPGTLFPVGTGDSNHVVCSVADINGNHASATFIVTVIYEAVDTTPPVLSLGSLTGTSVVPNSSIFDLRDVMKTEITATDASGISTIPPAISVSSTFPNGNSSDQIKDDGNDGMVWCDNSQYWYNGGVVITLPVGETTIKCAVWDNSENFTIESFTLVVLEDHVDTTPSQSYTVLVNEMGGSIAANDPGGCASFNPQTCYTPSDITINVGDSVTWVNNDSTNNWYTLMGNWGSLASSSGDNACDGPGKLALDMCGVSGNDRTSWTHTFDAVGTYNYHDWVYQNSAQRPEGVVNVVASGAPTPVAVAVLAEAASNFAPEISPIIGSANYLSQTNQQAHEFSGNTAKVYVTFNENVPTLGSLVNIISVFPNAQTGVSLNNVNVPYTLTYPGGVEEGTITSINTSDHYDMVLSINNAPVAGHYTFQTELISTSFDVYDPNTAEGQQASQVAEENNSSQISTITAEYVDQSDDRFFANESFTIQGNWNKPGQSNQANTNQCHVWVSLNVYNSGGSYQQCTTSFPLYIMYYHPDTGTESRSTTLYTTLNVDSNGNFSTTLNANDIAYAGPGHYAIRAEPSVNDVFAGLDFWLIEENPNASIQITADKTTLDRNIQNDFAEVTINYQNLNSVAAFIIQTPDGVDHNVGGFSTNAYLTSGQQGMTTGNVGIYDFTNNFNSFMYVIDDGATRGELEFQIIGTPQILANSTIATVAESGFSPDCVETGCYTPTTLTVNVGDLINMTNTDPTGLPHTFTAGTVEGFAQNPSGVFDSGFMEAGDSFTWTPQTDVDQPYYCILHPWMVGTIVVGDVDVVEAEPTPQQAENFTVEMTENGFSTNELQINAGDSVTFINTHYVTDINVEPHAISDPFAVPYTEHSYWIIDDSTPERVYNFDSCESYVFYDRFFDVEPIVIECGDHAAEEAAAAEAAAAEAAAAEAAAAEAAAAEAAAAEAAAEEAAADVELMVGISYSEVMGGTQVELDFSELHVNYDMTATQNGEVVFEETGLHSMDLIATHQIDAVGSDENPINVKVESLGIGAPGNEDNWTGPVGQVTTAQFFEIAGPGVDDDTTPPVLTQNQNITLDATTSNGAIVNYESPLVTDNESHYGPTCTPASGSFFQTGTTEVTCSASDWAGNVGTTSFTVTVNSLIAAPVEITTDVSITIGKSVYNTDDAIFVTGIATPFTENNVSIQVEDSSDNVVLVEQITPESSGIYTGIIFPNFLWSTSGNYTMSATYGNSTANTSFGFEFLEPVIDEYLSPTGITLQTDTSMYTIGDTIIIESALTDVGSDYQIGIFVEDPTGELRSMQFLNTDDSGSVSLSLKAQDNWIPGKYLVGAYDVLDNSATIRESVSFDIVKPIPEITISPTVTTTESGDTITSYDAGDMAYFSTSLLSESTSDVLVTINVVDSDDTTLGVAFFKSIIGKGDSELVLGFKIPEDAADGVAKIYVNTYTDWIDNGGIVIGSELLSEVNIDGVIIEVVEETVVEETVVEETVLPENTIPRLSTVTDITQSASFTTGSVVSYSLPIATSGATTLDATCTPAPGSMFPIGSTQVTCTATNDFGNTGMTSFMVTINPILQTTDQSLSVKVGKDSYNNLEPLFVTGSVGTVTGEPINLEVRDTQNNLISIEQVTPKESSVYSAVLTSNELWDNTGEYTIIAKYEGVIALDTFEFELVEVEEVIPEKIPTSLFIDTLDSAYVLGDVVGIGVNLVDAGAGESILLEIKDSQNDQVLIQSLNTDSNGIAVFLHQLDSSGEPGVYSVTAISDEWNFSNSENFIAVAQIPDITVGDVISTLQNGTEVDSFESGDMGYFQTPIISESVSNVLITVNIFDVENTPLGLAYFNSKVVDDTFDITLGLQIPQDAVPGLATVYINTFTDWPNEGGVPILEQQVSFIEISPASTTSLTVSSEEPEPVVEQVVNCGPGTENVNGICETPITGNISVNTESTSYATGNTIVISGYIKNLAEYEQPVVILIVSPDGNLVSIDQVSPDSSGNYSTTVKAGGTMNSNGEYEVRAQYGASKITSTFDFASY